MIKAVQGDNVYDGEDGRQAESDEREGPRPSVCPTSRGEHDVASGKSRNSDQYYSDQLGVAYTAVGRGLPIYDTMSVCSYWNP